MIRTLDPPTSATPSCPLCVAHWITTRKESTALSSSHSPISSAMALPKLLLLLLLTNAASFFAAQAQVEDAALSSVIGDSIDWPSSFPFAPQVEDDDDGGLEFYGGGEMGKSARRSLFWHRMRFYISYAALSANRVPCPPRSGRSPTTPTTATGRGDPFTLTPGIASPSPAAGDDHDSAL